MAETQDKSCRPVSRTITDSVSARPGSGSAGRTHKWDSCASGYRVQRPGAYFFVSLCDAMVAPRLPRLRLKRINT